MNLSRFVRGDLPASCQDPRQCASQLHAERLAPLVLSSLRRQRALPTLQKELMPHALHAAARDLAQEAVLTEVLTATADIRILVVKGAATGPLLYGSGSLRPRLDTDLLVDGWDAVESVCDRLRVCGWRAQHQLPGKFVRHAVALRRGPFEDIDVHARPCKRIRVANALPFNELWATRDESLGFPTLSARHAWLLGATHLTAHHAGQTPPRILLEDLVRLGDRMSEDDWLWLWTQGCRFGLLSAIRHAVECVTQWHPTASEPGFRRAILSVPEDESARFATELESVLDDLELLPPDDASTYLGELLLPPQEYLLEQLGVARRRPTLLLQGARLALGLSARLRRNG